jgi:lipoic acid synthetase
MAVIKAYRLHTVCEGAECPNRGACFGEGTATLMILGAVCTRNCRFCAVTKGRADALDPDEPRRVAAAICQLGLDYAVITSVTRDDLPDGGAGAFAAVIRQIRAQSPRTLIEVLTPDFRGNREALQTVADACPDVFNHNLETVPRLYSSVRPQANYRQSLQVLARMKKLAPEIKTKSGFMVGLGERKEEVRELLTDLRQADCDLVTIGQYLSPSKQHLPVVGFITPEEFAEYERIAYSLGFAGVASGPLVRSSFHAKQIYDYTLKGMRSNP